MQSLVFSSLDELYAHMETLSEEEIDALYAEAGGGEKRRGRRRSRRVELSRCPPFAAKDPGRWRDAGFEGHVYDG